MTAPKLTDTQRAEMCEDFLAGESVPVLARRYGISQSGAFKVVRPARPPGGKERQAPPVVPWVDGYQDRSWQDDAACFMKPYNGFTEWPIDQQVAFCKGFCAVRDQCLEAGIAGPTVVNSPELVGRTYSDNPDQGVVYGGLTPRELHKLQVQRRKAMAS